MPITLRIAFRNLREHKAKSFIVGTLMALGMLILVLGNSLLDTANAGVRESFVKSFSGDIMIRPVAENPTSLFGRSFMTGAEDALPTVPEYQTLDAKLRAMPEVESVSPQISGPLILELPNDGQAFTLALGVDVGAYTQTFPDNLTFIKGGMLQPGKPGILLSKRVWEDYNKELGSEVKVGDELKASSFSSLGFKIRRLPVVGVFEFKSKNKTLDVMSLVDAETLRAMLSMVATTEKADIKPEDNALISSSTDDLDAMFGGDLISQSSASATTALSQESLNSVLGDTSKRASLNETAAGAWHYTLIRLKDPSTQDSVLKKLNAEFAAAGGELQAVDWTAAAGPVSGLIAAFRLFFTVLVIILAVVSVIVIMNTLVASIIERTSEIGMMRALGGQRTFVRSVFLSETMVLSLISGLIGLLLGFILIVILGLTGIPAPDELFAVVFGGPVLNPVFSFGSALWALVIMGLVGLISSLYPIAVALKVQPVRAMQA